MLWLSHLYKDYITDIGLSHGTPGDTVGPSSGPAPLQRPGPDTRTLEVRDARASVPPRRGWMSARLVPTKSKGIFKRGSRYVIRFRSPDGRVRQRSAATMAEARDLKATLATDVRRGEYRELSNVTFSEYAEQWVDTYTGRTSRGIRPATLADYNRILEREATPFFGRMRLAEIEPQHVKRYAKSVADRGVKPNTVRLAVAPVKALFATAFEEGLIRTNPGAGVRLVTGVQVEEGDGAEHVKALTEAELRTL